MTLLSATILLLVVLDPFGNIPFFLAALRPVDPARHRRIIVRELLIALAALIVFLFGGQYVLAYMQISEPSVSIAGGVILLLIAIRMIFPRSGTSMEEHIDGEPFIVPLAIPYVAGPSALVSAMFIMRRDPARWPVWLAATVLAWLITATLIYFASGLSRLIGQRGLIAVERLMGMLLIALAVQMVFSGILGLGTFSFTPR